MGQPFCNYSSILGYALDLYNLLAELLFLSAEIE